MPDQEKERTSDFYSDGSVEVIQVEPYFCEICNIEHNTAVRLIVSSLNVINVIYDFSENCCDVEFIKDGVNTMIASFPDWDTHIIFNTTHERDHCYDVCVYIFGNR